MSKQLPIAAAILVGFAMVAAAIYFRPTETSAVVSKAPVFEEEATPWENSPKTSASDPLVAEAYKKSDEVVRDSGVFLTSFKPHRDTIRTACNVDQLANMAKNEWYLEMPLEMKFDASGILIAGRRFSQLRVLQDTGEAIRRDVEDPKLKTVTTCVIAEITKRVRMPKADQESTLKMWVPIASTID